MGLSELFREESSAHEPDQDPSELVQIPGRRCPIRLIPGGERIPSGGNGWEIVIEKQGVGFSWGTGVYRWEGKKGKKGYWVERERDFLSLSMID